MSFIESPRFPDDISQGSKGGPEYNTTIVVVKSGHEKRIANWTYPRHVYDVAYGVKSQDDLESLIDYFHVAGGMSQPFRYKDWLDYKSVHTDQTPSATDQTIGTGDNSETDFQLVKNYVKGSYSRQRLIAKPVSGTVLISIDDVAQGSGWSVDTTTGIVTFDTAPATDEVIKAGFEFDVPVRFESDELMVSLDDYKMGAAQVLIKETRDIS
jgi:uncharacterized protein (TIGR02217 family)